MKLTMEPPSHYNVRLGDYGTWARFVRFWQASPKTGSRKAAWRAFLRLAPEATLLETMLSALEAWKGSDEWQESGGRFIPHMRTWISQARWETLPPKPDPWEETYRRLLGAGMSPEMARERASEIMERRSG